MPSMPRTPKAKKIAYKILGKPENEKQQTYVYKTQNKLGGINRTLDAWYNHKV